MAALVQNAEPTSDPNAPYIPAYTSGPEGLTARIELPESAFPLTLHPDVPWTDDQLLAFCAANELLRVEREPNGEITIMAPTGTEGGNAELDIAADLTFWARQDGRGRALGPNSGIKLPDTAVRAADAGWVSFARYSQTEGKGYRQFVPEFVIEVRSASDRLPPLRRKMEKWIGAGVELAWLIDPSRKAVEIYRPNQAPEIQEGHTAVYGEGPVAGFILELARIWG
jgi:Uma2 family endonuclease